MAFLSEPEPPRGIALPVIPGISRIVARNPSLLTYHGTNTYLIEHAGGVVVLDPGPDDLSHVGDILAATHGRISSILLSHTHPDHLGATRSLAARTGAPTCAFRVREMKSFVPDIELDDGHTVDGLTAVHTPGHALDHLCFARSDGALFTADHVMSWSSSIVSPPNGDMALYFANLRSLLDRDDRIYLPGHGPAILDPKPFVEDMLHHRQKREEGIFLALKESGLTSRDLVDRLYGKTDPNLRWAAERNVIAHLLKLEGERLVEQDGERWRASRQV